MGESFDFISVFLINLIEKRHVYFLNMFKEWLELNLLMFLWNHKFENSQNI